MRPFQVLGIFCSADLALLEPEIGYIMTCKNLFVRNVQTSSTTVIADSIRRIVRFFSEYATIYRLE